MILYNSESSFSLKDEKKISVWIEHISALEGFTIGEINYIFCDDIYLNSINKEFLNHDSFTDIISFDYTLGQQLNGLYINRKSFR